MEDQGRNDKAEQESRNERNQQETEQILKSQRQDKRIAPSMFLKILEIYLIFVTTVVGVGVLAFYIHYDRTSKIVFVAAGALVLIVPVATIWYLIIRFRKGSTAETVASAERNLLTRFAQSFVGRSLLWLTNNPIFRLLNLALTIFVIVRAIRGFAAEPRTSLAIIVPFVAGLVITVTLEIVRPIEKRISKIWDVLDKHLEIFQMLVEQTRNVDAKAAEALLIAEAARKFIVETEPQHMEMHKATSEVHRTTAIALREVWNVVANNVVQPEQSDAQQGQEETPKSESD